MSWSVSASGEPKEVVENLTKQFASITYLTGPEKGLKESSEKLIAEALAAYEFQRVRVSANGHAGINGEAKYQNLHIDITAV